MMQSTNDAVSDLSSSMANDDAVLHQVLLFIYRIVLGTIRLASPLLSKGESKLARGMAGRRRAHELLAVWGGELRDPDRPVVWFHAPSVGEARQAQAVVRALKIRCPGLQVAFTFFSPSAEALGRDNGVDVDGYLPWDLKATVTAALDGVRPDVICFTKTEVWPVLVDEARRRGVPVAMVAATVPDGAGRMRWPVRALLQRTWGRFVLVGSGTERDAKRLISLGVPEAAIHVTGDPGVDSALCRLALAESHASFLAPFYADPRPTVVAGSTWPSDENVLLPALRAVRDAVGAVRVVIAPHEPGIERVQNLLDRFRDDGWRAKTLAEVDSTGDAEEVDVVVVERIGVLASLYRIASVSYVGGGYHDAGLHSVLEPAAAATPVVFGPHCRKARAAGELVAAGGARIVRDRNDLAGALCCWLEDEGARSRAGAISFDYIDRHRGAADRTADVLDPLIRRAKDDRPHTRT